MLPDFPEIKRKLMRRWMLYAEERRRLHLGVFADAPSYRHYEGNRFVWRYEDGSENESFYEEVSHSFSIPRDAIPGLSQEDVAQKIDEVSKSIATQQAQAIVQDIFEEATGSGSLAKEESRRFDKDLFFEALNSIMVSFDKKGNPNLPVLFVSPQIAQHVKEQLDSWLKDPILRQQLNQIIQRKREEWRVRESRRRLVE